MRFDTDVEIEVILFKNPQRNYDVDDILFRFGMYPDEIMDRMHIKRNKTVGQAWAILYHNVIVIGRVINVWIVPETLELRGTVLLEKHELNRVFAEKDYRIAVDTGVGEDMSVMTFSNRF